MKLMFEHPNSLSFLEVFLTELFFSKRLVNFSVKHACHYLYNV